MRPWHTLAQPDVVEGLPGTHAYVQEGLRQRVAPDAIKKSVALRDQIVAHGAVPVLTLRHLSHLSDVDWKFLRTVVSRSADPYRSVRMESRGGKSRELLIPNGELMKVQRWILKYVLGNAQPHPSSFAYEKGRSAYKCAERHLGCRHLVKMDIERYFDNFREVDVYQVFLGLGYTPLMSFEMARLCTWPLRWGGKWGKRPPVEAKIPHYSVNVQGSLPQGAPTSGALSNLSTVKLDDALSGYASAKGLVYTRYSDDISFSTSFPVERHFLQRIILDTNGMLLAMGFAPNVRKTRIVGPGARRIVLGLDVSDDKVQVEKSFLVNLEFHIWAAGRHGVANHSRHRGFASAMDFVSYIDGCLSYVAGVDLVACKKLSGRWKEVLGNA